MIELNVVLGDITNIFYVDAIVNAANTSLLGGGGVDGAIHRKGGKTILEECQKIRLRQGGCKIGEAVITSAGLLNAKNIIHTVGPKWVDGSNNEIEILAKSYENSLKLAENFNLHSIAFPNISTGIYGFPKEIAVGIAINTIREFELISTSIRKVYFICHDKENYNLYIKYLT